MIQHNNLLIFSLIIGLGLLSCSKLAVETGVETKSEGMERLRQSLRKVRFVAYSPTLFNPLPNQKVAATDAVVREDLTALRPYFDGLITYSCGTDLGLDRVVPIAQELKYSALLLGIWGVGSEVEIQTAVKLTHEYPDLIVGIIVGNEGLTLGHYGYEELEGGFARVRELLPEIPLSTSEPIGAYGDMNLLEMVDFHTPNIHWWFSGGDRQDYQGAVKWLEDRIKAIRSFSDKPILVKEASLPSGPVPHASEEIQKGYWKTLLETIENTETLAIAFFEAFDAGDWKTVTNASDISAVEKHWGAFTNDRRPKPVVDMLPKRR